MSVPGIGPIISSAMVAAIGSGEAFSRGRDFSAWIGLVPSRCRQETEPSSGRYTKRGNGYLRTLFVQAARVILFGRRAGEATASKLWLERCRSGCTVTF